MNILIEYEGFIRIGVFFTLFVLLAGAEFIYPLAKRKCGRVQQWSTNLTIVVIASVAIKLLFPLLAVGVAQFASTHSIGFFNLFTLPTSVTIVLSLLLLDLLIYGQHRMMHEWSILWKLHRVHHTELGLDVSSAVRFHPVEIFISMAIKMLFVLLMGIPVTAVIIFEVLLNGLALFNHSNLKLNKTLDKWLRKCIVTPEVHWIHHSKVNTETNSNYGFNLIIWDKIFATYIDKPRVDYPEMPQGVPGTHWHTPFTLVQLLLLPFKKNVNKKSPF